MRRHWNHPELEARSTYSRRRFLLAGAVGCVPLVLHAVGGQRLTNESDAALHLVVDHDILNDQLDVDHHAHHDDDASDIDHRP